MRRVRKILAPPNDRAGFLVESGDGALRSAGRDDYPVAIHQRRFSEAPIRARAIEVFDKIFAPFFDAGGALEANQFTPLIERKQQLAIHGRYGARTPIATQFAG